MGPYYRGTSHGVGAFFDMFYQHPLLMLAFMAGVAGAGIYFWRKKKSENQTTI